MIKSSMGGAVMALALGTSTPALACGGFFCDTPPGTQFQSGVVQTRETIVFAIQDDPEQKDGSTVEAHVQIAYSGDVDDFAWVLPLPGVPEIGITTDLFFNALRAATTPSYTYTTKVDPTCYRLINEAQELRDKRYDGDDDSLDSDASAMWETDAVDTQDASQGGVVVLSSSEIGPYVQTTLQADTPDSLTAWLTDNGFDLPDNYTQALAGYVVPGNSFVVLKLQKGKEVGDLRPLRLRWPGDAASLPITLTSVAAEDDMPLDVYILGDERYVPDNYLHVEINEAAIDWPRRGANRLELITAAADEAGGQAFATAWAGKHWDLSAQEVLGFSLSSLDSLRDRDDAADFLQRLFNRNVRYDDALLGLLRLHMPLDPELLGEDLTDLSAYGCPDCWPEVFEEVVFDPDALVQAIEDEIRAPIRYADNLMNRTPYLTRLESSMSAPEMTADPVFVANPDLPDVAKDHTAHLEVVCYGTAREYLADRKLYLEDGRILQYSRVQDPRNDQDLLDILDQLDAAAPAASRISDLAARGTGSVLTDNSLVGLPPLWTPSDKLVRQTTRGCQTVPSAPAALSLGLGLLLTVSRRRRSTP